MIAKELQKALSEESENEPPLPWWARLGTIERALALKDEIEGQVASLSDENRAFRQVFRRLGFAGHPESQ